MASNKIKAIGVELEGAWSPDAQAILKRMLVHDGSVRGFGGEVQSGEVKSQPLSTIEAAESFVRTHYPNEVNESCGFHVHVSMAPLHYSRLMNEDFNNCFLNAMEDFWSRFRSEPGFNLFRHRLDGQNRYCQKVFRPEEQIFRTEAYGPHDTHPRYSQLNYCWGRHGTMECRLFPCFPRYEHSVEGMKAFINCINSFLATCQSEKPIEVTIAVDQVAA